MLSRALLLGLIHLLQPLNSIPLTLEWSASSPHDMILAGCHDGVVHVLFATSTVCHFGLRSKI